MADFVHPDLGLLGIIPTPSRAPLKESLGFLTDIIPSYDGGEERYQVRPIPRQRVSFDFTAQPSQSKDVFNTIYGGMARKWGVPLWHQARAGGNIIADQTVIPVDTRYADFRAGTPVLLLGRCGEWQVRMVDSMAEDALTLASGALAMKGAYVMPVRIGRVVSSGEKTTSGYGSEWRLGFEVDDNLALTPEAPDQYFADDIYLTPGLLDGDHVAERVNTALETFDFDLGAVNAFTPWTNNRTSRPHRVITESDAESWELRNWLYRRAGRNRAFWQPSFENDVRLAMSGSVASSVTVRDDYRYPWAQNRVNLAFGLRDGTWLPRRVTDDTDLGGGLIELELNDDVGVDASQIIAISYLGYKRLNSDTIDLNWLGYGRCEMAVQVLELSP